MEETEVSHFLHILVRMGEALQNSGAEVFRVEDTLNRIAIAYGAEDVNVFVITSSIVVTLTMPSLPPQTETRRLRHAASNDLLTLEKLNALSRRICTAPPSIEEFQRQLNAILAQHPDPRLHLAGSVLAASSFAIFFGGNLWDGLLAGRHCRSDLLDGALSLAFLYEWRRISVYSIISQRCLHSAALPLWDAVSCR